MYSHSPLFDMFVSGETLCQVQDYDMLSYCSFCICILSYWNYEAH